MIDDMKKLHINIDQDIYDFTLYQVYLNFRRTKYMPEEIIRCIFILSSNLFQTKFNRFQSKDLRFYELEKALRNNDYERYLSFCIFFQ